MRNKFVLFLGLLVWSTCSAAKFDEACLTQLQDIADEITSNITVDHRNARVTVRFRFAGETVVSSDNDSLLTFTIEEVKRGRVPIGAILTDSEGTWATLTIPFALDAEGKTVSCITYRITSISDIS